MKTKKITRLYIKFPGDGYEVEARDVKGKLFNMNADAFHLSWNKAISKVFMDYAGEQAGDSYSRLEMPLDADFLKKMAKDLRALAKHIEEGDV